MKYYKEQLLNSYKVPLQLKNYISTIELMKRKITAESVYNIMPDMLWSGNVYSMELAEIFCAYLAEENIIDFCGEKKCIYIELNEENLSDTGIYAQINDFISLAGGFRGKFKGVICIKIQTSKHLKNELAKFLKYIRENTSGCLRIVMCDEPQADDIMSALHSALYRIKKITADRLSSEVLTNYIRTKFNEYNLSPDIKTFEHIGSIIQELLKSHKVKNWEEADILFCDIIFYILGHSKSSTDFSDIIDDYYQKYILSELKKRDKCNNIGFIREDERNV